MKQVVFAITVVMVFVDQKAYFVAYIGVTRHLINL